MTENKSVERMVALLERRGILIKYERYLLTPYFVQDIILATNEGEIKGAISSIAKAEKLINMLREDLETEDIEHLLGIIQQIRRAVSSAGGNFVLQKLTWDTTTYKRGGS